MEEWEKAFVEWWNDSGQWEATDEESARLGFRRGWEACPVEAKPAAELPASGQ